MQCAPLPLLVLLFPAQLAVYISHNTFETHGKCPTKGAGFAPNVEHLPPIMSIYDLSDVRMALEANHGTR